MIKDCNPPLTAHPPRAPHIAAHYCAVPTGHVSSPLLRRRVFAPDDEAALWRRVMEPSCVSRSWRVSGLRPAHIAGGDRSAGPPTAWIYATPNRRRRLIRLAGKDQPGQIEMTDGAVRPGHDPERFACVITIPAQPCAVPGRLEPGGRIVIGSGRGTVRYCRALRPQRPGAALGLRRYQPRPSGFGGFDCRALAAVDSDPGRESLKMRRAGGWVSPPGRSLA